MLDSLIDGATENVQSVANAGAPGGVGRCNCSTRAAIAVGGRASAAALASVMVGCVAGVAVIASGAATVSAVIVSVTSTVRSSSHNS